MKKITLMFAAALMALAPLGASAAVRVFVGGGPVVGYGFYGPRFYGPVWGRGYWGPPAYYYTSDIGSVKIDSHNKEEQVFVNGSYAGLVKDNKTMHFRQGSYNIEIRNGGRAMFSEKVYVTAGKTIHIGPA